MLYNYLKISIAVLLRRKFLTFVNLFGAAITLTVLVVAFAVFESLVSPAGAQHRQNHTLIVKRLRLIGNPGTMGGGPGRAFHDEYVAPLTTPDLISFVTGSGEVDSYVDGRKLSVQLRRTDTAYWQIMDFDLLDGRLLSADDIDNGRFVAVINQATAERFFPDRAAIGATITAGSERFEVIGVVANEPITNLLAFSDVWVPLTTSAAGANEWVGDGQSILYFEDRSRMRTAREEFSAAIEDFVYTPDPAQFGSAVSSAQTMLEILAASIVGELAGNSIVSDSELRSLVAEFVGLVAVIVVLFMALPAINMANLNMGRILERAPEIGLRKAAGASRLVLTGQFIFENLVLSLLGGLLAFALDPLILGILNETVFPYGQLGLNLPALVAGFGFIALFGVLSGAWPAWKMSRLDPAAALRGLQHA